MIEKWDAYDKYFNKIADGSLIRGESYSRWGVSFGRGNYCETYGWYIFTHAEGL